MPTLSKLIGIDLGSANVVVSAKGRGVVLNEPSVVAYSASDSRVVAVGSHARQLLGRTPGRIIVSRPMRDGVIADCVVTEAMLTYFIGKVVTRFSLFRPVVMVCLGLGANGAFGRAVVHAAMQAGALDVQVIAEPLAAALGANVPISSASANMVVDLGAAWTKAAVLSRNHTIVSHSVGIGGNKIDEMIASYVRRKHNLIIGERTAEEIKFAIGSAVPLENDLEVEVRGRDATEGLPTLRSVRSSEVTEAIGEALLPIVRVVNQLLDRAPAELAPDLRKKGLVLTGGGALLRNLDRLLMQQTGVPASVAHDPLTCSAIGAVRAFALLGGLGHDGIGVGARLPKHPFAPYDHAAAVPPEPLEFPDDQADGTPWSSDGKISDSGHQGFRQHN